MKRGGSRTRPIVPSDNAARVARDTRAQVRRILQMPEIQTKLTVGPPDDEFEREADRVADQVMRMTDTSVLSHADGDPRIQRMCKECQEEETSPTLRRAPENSDTSTMTPGVEASIRSLVGTGQPLPESERIFFEQRFQRDFGDVRVRADPEARALARGIKARAFTLGQTIALGRGANIDGSAAGRRLLAHELSHVVQQGESSGPHEQATVQRDDRVQTPYDKLVVERARKRVALLKQYVDEYAAREARRLSAQRERAGIVPKREQMDIQGSNPFASLEHRGEQEAERIAHLNTKPLKIEVTEKAVTFRIRFHVRFDDPKHEARFSELASTLRQGIRLVWNQTLRGDVFGGRSFGIEPEIVKVAAAAPRDVNYWLITVRPIDTGAVNYPGCTLDQPDPSTPTSVTDPTCDGGIMSIPPLHVAKADILGHELLHLFGFIDRYMMMTTQLPTGKTEVALSSTRETKGRPDPLGADTGKALTEDIAFLFDRLGIYDLEQNRGLDVLRQLEGQGLTLGAVLGEIHHQEEIIRLGRDPLSLIPERKDFRDKILHGAEDL